MYLQESFHHATGHKGFPSSIIAGQVVEEGEQCGGKLVRVGFHQRIWEREIVNKQASILNVPVSCASDCKL